jgi:hypothetical protein
LGGEHAVRITTAPLKRPEAPNPATVRPAMTMLLDVESAQMRFPSSKMAIKLTYRYFFKGE